MPEPLANRRRRLAEELEESGLRLDGATELTDVLLEEIDHALGERGIEMRLDFAICSGLLDVYDLRAGFRQERACEKSGQYSRNCDTRGRFH